MELKTELFAYGSQKKMRRHETEEVKEVKEEKEKEEEEEEELKRTHYYGYNPASWIAFLFLSLPLPSIPHQTK